MHLNGVCTRWTCSPFRGNWCSEWIAEQAGYPDEWFLRCIFLEIHTIPQVSSSLCVCIVTSKNHEVVLWCHYHLLEQKWTAIYCLCRLKSILSHEWISNAMHSDWKINTHDKAEHWPELCLDMCNCPYLQRCADDAQLNILSPCILVWDCYPWRTSWIDAQMLHHAAILMVWK